MLLAVMALSLAGCLPGSRPAPTPEPEPIVTLPPTPAPTPTPTPAPEAEPEAEPDPEPPVMPAAPAGPAPVISKQPFGESQYIGSSATFIANADSYTDVGWRAVTPDGQDVSMETFQNAFPDAAVSNVFSNTLTIGNVSQEMNGWSFYCVFGNKGTLVITNRAELKILGRAAYVPPQAQDGETDAQNTVAIIGCPVCGEAIPANTRVCPHCLTFINDQA